MSSFARALRPCTHVNLHVPFVLTQPTAFCVVFRLTYHQTAWPLDASISTLTGRAVPVALEPITSLFEVKVQGRFKNGNLTGAFKGEVAGAGGAGSGAAVAAH